MLPAARGQATERSVTRLTYRVQVSDSGAGSSRRRWFGLLVLASAAIGAVAAGREVAMRRADREFEVRLRSTDANRD
jgi:hypothetical protein